MPFLPKPVVDSFLDYFSTTVSLEAYRLDLRGSNTEYLPPPYGDVFLGETEFKTDVGVVTWKVGGCRIPEAPKRLVREIKRTFVANAGLGSFSPLRLLYLEMGRFSLVNQATAGHYNVFMQTGAGSRYWNAEWRKTEVGITEWRKEDEVFRVMQAAAPAGFRPTPDDFKIQIVFLVIEQFPGTDGIEFVEIGPPRKRKFGRSERPAWLEVHNKAILGSKFRRQQKIVEKNNQAAGRGRAGTGLRKILARVGDKVSDAMMKEISKHVGKRSKIAGAASSFALKLAKATLKKKAATLERQRKRGLKTTRRIRRLEKTVVESRFQKEIKSAAKGVKLADVAQDKSLERIVRRQKAAARREVKKILATRRRWKKQQAKLDRERRRFARRVARLVREADKRALRKLSFRTKRPCFPTQQRRRRRKRRLTSRGTRSRRRARKTRRALGTR